MDNDIQNEYDDVRSIYSLFQNLKGTCKDFEKYELEYRFKSVDVDEFNRLLMYLQSNKCYKYVTYIYHEQRIRIPHEKAKIFHRIISTDNDVKIESKTQIKKYSSSEVYDRWMSLVVSLETDIQYSDHINKTEIIPVKKERHSFIIMDGKWGRVDLTNINNGEKYSIELELMETEWGEIKLLESFIRIIKDSPMFIKRHMYDLCLSLASKKYTKKGGTICFFCIKDKKFQTPITMLKNQIVDKDLKIFKGGFYITPKLDGVRRFLIMFNNNCYSIDAKNKIRYEGCFDAGAFGYTHGSCCILDCEFLDKVYHVIDVVVYEDNYIGDTLKSPQNRLKMFFNRHHFPNNSFITPKHYVDISTDIDDIDKIGNRWKLFFKHMDGLIIVSKVYSGACYKIKYITTIDLEYDEDRLWSSDRVDFTYLYSSSLPLNQQLDDGNIYEFDLLENGSIILQRKRYDKMEANYSDVIKNNLSPTVLSMNVFRGYGAIMMRKYHNITKKLILTDFVHINGSILMDFGSGQGGDITKWIGANKIYAIEPSSDARAEFQTRFFSEKKKDKKNKINYLLEMIPSKSSDHDTIIKTVGGDDIGIFSLFFCLNLFSDDDLTGLYKIIEKTSSNNCRVVGSYMTCPSVDVKNVCYNITKKPTDNLYEFIINGSRINQIERVFDFNKFEKNLAKLGFDLFVHSTLGTYNSCPIMSSNEKTLNSLFRIFEFRNKRGLVRWWKPSPEGIIALPDESYGRVEIDDRGIVRNIIHPRVGCLYYALVYLNNTKFCRIGRPLSIDEMMLARMRLVEN